jgi:hypothetical protein
MDENIPHFKAMRSLFVKGRQKNYSWCTKIPAFLRKLCERDRRIG